MIKQLNDQDRAQLAGLPQIPGFKVFLTLCDNEINHLNLDIIQAKATDRDEILARHNRAQAAVLFYQNVTKQMSLEIESFTSRHTTREIGPDPTAVLYE
jgi:hypothetical protein